MFSQLEKIFGSKTKAQEILLLLEDAKGVVRQGFYPRELVEIENFCREKNLFLIKSKFKIILDDKCSYSNKGTRIDENSPEGMHFVYISKSENKSLIASYYELVGDDHNLGLVLGYPECCVKFFCQNFNQDRTNLELKPNNLWTNLTKRKNDSVLLSHFPCNSECNESVKLAKRNFKILKAFDEERAGELLRSLVEGGDDF